MVKRLRKVDFSHPAGHYCEGGSMIPVDLSANREGWIYAPNGSVIHILGIRARDLFSGSPDMSAPRQGNFLQIF